MEPLGSVLQKLPTCDGNILLAAALVLVAVLLLFWGRSKEKAENGKRALSTSKVGNGPSPADVEQLFQHLFGLTDELHVEGTMVPSSGLMLSNEEEVTPFENELCSGKFLEMHKATHDKQLAKSGCYRYGEYFQDKKRYWESRVQLKFKVAPKQEDINFGVELRDYVPMNATTRGTMAFIVRSMKAVVGHQVYHSVGDDPAVVSGPLERPVFVMPLWAFDQFIVTPEGEEPPALTDSNIPKMGSCRFKRVKEYSKEIGNLEFKPGPTYTFCFWGISRFLDKINWKVLPPLSPSLSVNMLCGAPPCEVVMYTLDKRENGDQRHLTERKNYYFKVAFWSSMVRPSWERLDELFGKKGANVPGWPASSDPDTWPISHNRRNNGSVAKGHPKEPDESWMCCGAR